MDLNELFPNASAGFLALNSRTAPKLERSARNAALPKSQREDAYSGRFLVRVKSFRHRLLDEDNLCEKYHVDCLRYAGIISDDSAAKTKIEVSQEKIGSKETERIEITVTRITT